MTELQARKLLSATFTGGELHFLFANAEFKRAVVQGTGATAHLLKLKDLGKKLLLASALAPNGGKRSGPRPPTER